MLGEEAIRRNEGAVSLMPPQVQRVHDKIPQDPGKVSTGGGLCQLTIEETGLGTWLLSGHRSYGLNKPQTVISTMSAHHTERSPC